jgi:aminoglycoside phosphotransferase (APT) family kinase protein
MRVVVFEFIDGRPLRAQHVGAAAVASQLARLVAAIHAATPTLAVPVPFMETFEVWADGLRACLAALTPGAGGADELRAQAQALVWPQRTALLGMQERVHTLGEVARSQPGERVLCHGDLIDDNLLADRGGRLWVVDWDAAALAPRERDLALFAGKVFQRFPDRYERAAGGGDLDPDLVAFFLLRRNLDDLVDLLGGVLTTDRPDHSGARTWTGCAGAWRAGARWRHASSTPAWCWRGGTGPATACAELLPLRGRFDAGIVPVFRLPSGRHQPAHGPHAPPRSLARGRRRSGHVWPRPVARNGGPRSDGWWRPRPYRPRPAPHRGRRRW